jgi:hypothetical protein
VICCYLIDATTGRIRCENSSGLFDARRSWKVFSR